MGSEGWGGVFSFVSIVSSDFKVIQFHLENKFLMKKVTANNSECTNLDTHNM
jgi:hypothetical protein